MKKKSKAQKLEQKLKVVPKPNPFDLRFNKIKRNVLGRKIAKSEFGHPTQSRSKEYLKRKETLLKEYKIRDKTGKGLLDKRVNIKGGVFARKSKLFTFFDINENDNDLTHKGVSLSSINLNEALEIDDDEDFDLLKRNDYIESAHFGGGSNGQAKSSQQFLDELMIDKRKKQLEQEKNIELTAKLDEDWNAVRNLMRHKGIKNEKQNEEDDYDILLNQLMFGGENSSKLTISSDTVKKDEVSLQINTDQFFAEKLSTLTSNADFNTIYKCVQEIMSCEVKLVKSDLIEKLLNYINNIEVKNVSPSTFGLIVFCMTLKCLDSVCILKSINILKALSYSNVEDICKRLFLCKILHQTHEKNYFPEIVTSLCNLLILFTGEKMHRLLFIPNFLLKKLQDFRFLRLFETQTVLNLPKFNLDFVFNSQKFCKEKVKSVLFFETITLLSQMVTSYSQLDSFEIIFLNIKKILQTSLNINQEMKNLIENVLNQLNSSPKLTYLIFPRQRPLMITMLDPQIISNRKSRNSKRILYKTYKREFKSAQRELRKDSAFMRETILDEILHKDKIRKIKVKQLLADIAIERSLYKKN